MKTNPPDPNSTRANISAGLFKLALVLRHESWKSSGERGLTPTQSQVLALLATLGDGLGGLGGLGVTDVAEHLAITKGTVSAAVTTLERKGLIVKEAHAEDGRAVVLKLSRTGRRDARRLAQWPELLVDAIDTLPSEEQAGLLRGLLGLIRGLQEQGAIPLSRMCIECRFFHPNRYEGTERPHHCAYLDAPLANVDLRIDCAEMEPASETVRPQLLRELFGGAGGVSLFDPPSRSSDDD